MGNLVIYGHRGAKGEAPENTLDSFRHAYRHGIRHFELDLVLSKDGVPVLIHDLSVDRTTNNEGEVHDFTAAELAAMDARRNTPSWPKPVGVPTLEQLLDELPDIEHLQLEVKKDSKRRLNVLCNRLVEIIQRRHLYDRVVVTSSDGWLLRQIRRLDKQVKRGLVTSRKFPRPLSVALRLKCDYLCLGWKIASRGLVNEAQRLGLHVSTWTVNSIHDMLELEKIGVDSIITDFPTSTRMFFENRDERLLKLSAPSLPAQIEKNPQ